MSTGTAVSAALEVGNGILHLAPTWVPRFFAVPGGRIGLARQDLYSYGPHRGGIDERWLASTTQPDNGPDTGPNEGLSEIVAPDGERVLLRDAVDEMPGELIGAEMYEKWGRWPTLGKLFDNVGPLPMHIHPRKEHAALVGEVHKPEAYYFPPQYNQILHSFPHTFFGLNPGTTREDLVRCLERWNEGDNGVLDLSRAYRVKVGDGGWMMPPGVLHAPASAVTYEIQWGTDTFAMFQSLVDGTTIPWDLVVKNVPDDRRDDLDFIVSLVDWENNVRDDFKEYYGRATRLDAGGDGEGYSDSWVIHGTSLGEDVFSAKELIVQPGHSVTLRDRGPSGILVVQGHGEIGPYDAEAAGLVRFGELTHDEFFVTAVAAAEGFTVRNTGRGPLVILRHLGPGCQ